MRVAFRRTLILALFLLAIVPAPSQRCYYTWINCTHCGRNMCWISGGPMQFGEWTDGQQAPEVNCSLS
jgi:hypothetical protein